MQHSTLTMRTIVADLRATHPGVICDHRQIMGVQVIDVLSVPSAQRNQGIGTKFMRELCTRAKAARLVLALTPHAGLGSDPMRLQEFYLNLGFTPNDGTYPTREKLVLR